MKKIFAWMLALLLLIPASLSVSAAGENSFVLVAVSANRMIVEPERISYTPGQTIQEALLASDHDFVGLEQGFIYEIDGVTANFSLFYDGNGFDLKADAAGIRVLCIGVSSQYSPELLNLIEKMADYREMGNVQNYPDAASAYEAARKVVRSGDSEAAREALENLNAAIAAYNALLSGTHYDLTIRAIQGEDVLEAPQGTLTDGYGNVTTVTGDTAQVIAGQYRFCISDGGYNRTEGIVEVSADDTLEVTLPSGEWFGDVNILDASKAPYPAVQDRQAHTVTFQIPDTARVLSSLYLNVYQGAVPSRNQTRLRTVYTGINGQDYSGINRSWESTATALAYLVGQGMDGAEFALEAQYTGDDGFTQIQSYAVTIRRQPTLASLRVTGDGEELPVDWDGESGCYRVVTAAQTLQVDATAFGENYQITGLGEITAQGTHTIVVSAGGETARYLLEITKAEAAAVTVTAPQGVTTQIENRAGNVVTDTDGVYYLVSGESYTCRATLGEHYHSEFTFTARQGMNVQAKAPIAEDWLTTLALYDGSSAANRREYDSDRAFSSGIHSYVYQVSDCNTSVYIQATSNYTVTARYLTQTASAVTNGTEKSVTITKKVSDTDTAQILPQVAARSGCANRVMLRLSSTSGGVTYYQDYELTIARSLHLTGLTLSGQEELNLRDLQGNVRSFDRDVTEYRVEIPRDEEILHISGNFPNISGETDCCGGYYALINGEKYDILEVVGIQLDTARDEERISIRVCHRDDRAVATEYVLHLVKTNPVAVTFRITPADSVVYLTNDQTGKRILGENGVYLLTPGVSYSYTVTRTGYRGISGNLTAPVNSQTLDISLEKAAENTALRKLESQWPHLRQNSDNNGVIQAATPIRDEEAVLYWATKIGDGFDKNACGCPILVDGYLYTYAGSTLYKVDTVSGEIVATGQMDHASSFAINPPTYAEGMLFVGLADGCVQAFNAATLESLWIYRDNLGGQPNSSIVYHNGYIYTGFWVGETSEANFVCISATDEDSGNTTEEKLATWKYTSKGGFYWAGAYVCDDYLLVGTDDGCSGYTTGKARLVSFSPVSGEVLDEYTMAVCGDIRSSITCADGKFYFTCKGGYFFQAEVSSQGQIDSVRALKLYNYANSDSTPPMSTCTPTIYNGRAYVGVSGTSQFGAYSGHNITVIDIPNWEIAYTVRTQGYPQTSGVLTTAYEQENGCVYVYFFDNYTPGKLRILEDRPGQTKATMVSTEIYTDKGTTTAYETAAALFTPEGEQAQYAICSPIVDSNGTIYFKNDSAYLMAVGSTIEALEITKAPDKTEYVEGECFDGTGMQVTARYTNGTSRDVTKYVSWSTDPLGAEDEDFVISLPCVMYQNRDGKSGQEYPAPFTVLDLTIGQPQKLGDVNGDGTIDGQDAQMIRAFINGKQTLEGKALHSADVSGDGKVNMADVSLVMQYIAGRIDAFPGENGDT